MDFLDVLVVDAMLYGGIDRSDETYRLSGLPIGNASLDDAIDWLGDIANKPSEEQVITWETARIAEQTAIEDDRSAIETELSDYDVQNPHVRLVLELISDLTKAFINGQNPSTAIVYSGFVTRLNGSNLESAIKNYVTMRTGLSSFGTSISIANKQSIMAATHEYLQSVLLVWLAKKHIANN